MATPSQITDDPASLSEQQDLAAIDKIIAMAGAFHDLYERCGGVDAVIRELDDEEEDDLPA